MNHSELLFHFFVQKSFLYVTIWSYLLVYSCFSGWEPILACLEPCFTWFVWSNIKLEPFCEVLCFGEYSGNLVYNVDMPLAILTVLMCQTLQIWYNQKVKNLTAFQTRLTEITS